VASEELEVAVEDVDSPYKKHEARGFYEILVEAVEGDVVLYGCPKTSLPEIREDARGLLEE